MQGVRDGQPSESKIRSWTCKRSFKARVLRFRNGSVARLRDRRILTFIARILAIKTLGSQSQEKSGFFLIALLHSMCRTKRRYARETCITTDTARMYAPQLGIASVRQVRVRLPTRDHAEAEAAWMALISRISSCSTPACFRFRDEDLGCMVFGHGSGLRNTLHYTRRGPTSDAVFALGSHTHSSATRLCTSDHHLSRLGTACCARSFSRTRAAHECARRIWWGGPAVPALSKGGCS